MALDPNYECDSEFVKLMTRRSGIDLTIVALELARDANPRLDFHPTLEWLDERAKELAGPVARARNELAALEELAHCLAEDHDLRGDPACYNCADGSYLHRVIETRRGIPLSLSLVYMAVAERLGIDLKGVAAPLHFLTRYESVRGPLFVDPFSRGCILTQDQCIKWIRDISRLPRSAVEPALREVGPRTIVIRMLNNLKAVHVRQQNWPAAWIVQHRLTALQPAAYHERRDLAFISLRANRPGHAIDLLRSCLRTCPQDEKRILEHHLSEASTQLSRWN